MSMINIRLKQCKKKNEICIPLDKNDSVVQ